MPAERGREPLTTSIADMMTAALQELIEADPVDGGVLTMEGCGPIRISEQRP